MAGTRIRRAARRVRRGVTGTWRTVRRKVLNIAEYPALRRSPIRAVKYLLFDAEIDNFTYDIANREEVAGLIAGALGEQPSRILDYITELDSDTALAEAIAAACAARGRGSQRMPYGRRLGWYAVVRARKPAIVVETGVHDGLGSAVLLRALDRNASEGHEGRLISFDVRANVGWVVPTWLRQRYDLRIADALKSLDEALGDRRIDVFLHDSNHAYAHETAELDAAYLHATPDAVLLSDNAHGSTAMRDFCSRRGLAFVFVPERSRDHFYPGAGIGLALRQQGAA